MLKRVFLLLGAAMLLWLVPQPSRAAEDADTFVGPTQILFDGDSVYTVVSKEWLSASVRHQEKLLRYSVRMAYWREHISEDMGMVFDALGYPTGRVLATPAGHAEEWWYYGQLSPPLRFRDGALIDTDRFEELLGR